MAGTQYALVVEGLETLRDVQNLDKRVIAAARMAINRTLDHTRTQASREIRKQINFPASYVSPAQGRLAVRRRAKENDLEGSIRAQGRATSLARFATSRNPKAARKAGGVMVQVTPGVATFMKRAFLIELPAGGKPGTDTKGNLGLAIRLKPGETLRNRKLRAKPLKNGLYLLYGPSVSQAFGLISEDDAPETVKYLEDEFLRLLELPR